MPAATLRLPFRQRNFFRGFVLPNHGNHNSSVVSRSSGFAEAWTCPPFRFSLYSEARKKGNADGRTRARRVVGRWRRKCQRKWALCLDGSVSWLRKTPFPTPEGRRIYVSLHTRAAGFDNGTIPVSFSIHSRPTDNAN